MKGRGECHYSPFPGYGIWTSTKLYTLITSTLSTVQLIFLLILTVFGEFTVSDELHLGRWKGLANYF